MNFKNKKILITGATGGIGNCLVEKFYKLESKIIATGTNEEKFRFEFDWQGTCDPTPWLCIPTAIAHIEDLVDGGWSEVMEKNRKLTLEARKILSEELGLDLPCPDFMIASLASIIIPKKGKIANSVFDSDPLHSKLIKEFGIQVPVFNWPHHDKRYLRISAHLYNHIDEYKYLQKQFIGVQVVTALIAASVMLAGTDKIFFPFKYF